MGFSSFLFNEVKCCLTGIVFSLICTDLLYPLFRTFLTMLTDDPVNDGNMATDVTDEYCGSDLDDETNDEAATDSDDDEDLNYTDDDYTDDSDNDDDDDYKLVAVVDKKSSKFVSQKSVQAAVIACDVSKRIKRNTFVKWLTCGQKKIFLSVKNKEELNAIHCAAKTKGILTVKWANENSDQAFLFIGPDSSTKIDEITGHLKLF